MKRITYLCLAGLLLSGWIASVAAAQSSESLGDYARAARKEKKTAAKQFDNDNLPRTDKLSIVGQAPESVDKTADDQSNDASQAHADVANTPKTETPSADAAKNPAANDDAAAKQKADKEWKDKISAQKDKVDLLNRELDVLQREYRLRAAAFYADAGNRLRNSGSWDQEDAKYKQQIDDKQKAVDAAKQQLDDMQEQARKAGAN